MEGVVMVDYGQAIALIAKMFFVMTITVLLICVTLLLIGLIILGFIKVGRYLLLCISEAIEEPREKVLAYRLFALPQGGVKKVKG